MSELNRFLKANKIQKENALYGATKSLLDDKGNSLEWEIKHLTTKENDFIRDSCTVEIPINGNKNLYRQKLDTSKYIAKMMVASIVSPNLYDAQLQDSYDVRTPEDLLREMVDDPGEYADFAAFIQGFSGFNSSLQDKVDEAKN